MIILEFIVGVIAMLLIICTIVAVVGLIFKIIFYCVPIAILVIFIGLVFWVFQFVTESLSLGKNIMKRFRRRK